MKKSIFFLLTFLTAVSLLSAPMRASAADSSSAAGAVTTSSGSLNVRSSPSASAGIAAALPKGSYITLIARSGSWWQVEYANGAYGWCHSDYITPVAGGGATVKLSSGSLNVRSGPGTGYGKAASLYSGEGVVVLSTSGGWSRILYHGTKTGWVSSSYLSGQLYPALYLTVPSFKQTDSRWSGVTLGSSGKTIAQIGCATTAIAMMESCRTGATIYPDAMAGQLSYTASGSVYWPAHYTSVTSASNYLSSIYELLRQGKPVLLGAKNSAGSQHWVVVTGYTGGSSLTAAGFTIHDPGSNSRTTLQQFLNSYPTFYKYFYY